MTIRSIRAKFLLLVAGVALLVGAVSAGFELFMSGALLREQMVKRGRYIAQNLAYNSKYGVLTEDKPLLDPAPRGRPLRRGRTVPGPGRATSWGR